MPCRWTDLGFASGDDCVAKMTGKVDDPQAFCYSKAEALRHPDFKRIHREFTKYYGEEQGDTEYHVWLKDLKCDESKPYGQSLESFSFAKDNITRWKEDKENVYYKVLVGFPLTSMNGNVYSEKDLKQGAHSLIDVSVNLNHNPHLQINGVGFIQAEYEDGAVEAVLKVPKSTLCPICGPAKPLHEFIDEKSIVNVSLEADKRQAFQFTACALLTTDVLPGIPMARIFPLESFLSEAFKSDPKTLSVNSQKVRFKVVGLKVSVKKESVDEIAQKEAANPDGNMQCPTGQHWSPKDGVCVPDEACPDRQVWDSALGKCRPIENPTPEGTDVAKGTPAALDNSTEMSSLRVENHKLKAKVAGQETELLQTKESLTLEANAKTKAEGRIFELEKTVERLEKGMKQNNDEKVADGTKIKQLERRLTDQGEELERIKGESENLQKTHEELSTKYRDSLTQNLDLSKKLTQSNEDYLTVTKESEQLSEDLKKAKRHGKYIVTI